jgi:hypothetical protein
MFAGLVTYPLDVRLGGTDIQERVIDRLREFLGLDQKSPAAADIAASIAIWENAARA